MPFKNPEDAVKYREAWRKELAARQRARYAANREELCRKAREYRAANKEEKSEYNREYRLTNKAEINARRRERLAANREEINAKRRFERAANYEQIRKRELAYAAANREKVKKWCKSNSLRFHYNLDLPTYEAMLLEQKGLCFVCGQPETRKRKGVVLSLSVDHNHQTGAVRKLICRGCNLSIGLCQEDPNRIKRLADYLEQHVGSVWHKPDFQEIRFS